MRYDNGREYVNHSFSVFLEEEGIETPNYSSIQNGVGERANRTIVERARSMLIDSNLPKRYWAEAIATATYLINRSPSKALNGNTPEAAWGGRKPNLTYFKVFGYKAMVHIPKEKREKWDPKSREMIFVGYSTNVKGYKFIDYKTSKVVVSRDAVLLENPQIETKKGEIRNSSVNLETSCNDTDSEIETQDNSEESGDEEDTDHVGGLDAKDAIDASQNKQTESEKEQTSALRRSNRPWKPVTRKGYVRYYTLQLTNDQSKDVEEALNGEESKNWLEAMNIKPWKRIILGSM